jgi:hypothetical protein
VAPEKEGPFDCQELGFRWLNWVAEFSPEQIRKYELILLVRPQTQLPESANAWGKVTRLLENSFAAQYPLGPNLVFTQVLWFQYHGKIQGPFLWCEPDCVPVKSNWLDLIAAAYARGGKPFMGNIVDSFMNQNTRIRVPRHMTGNAVYPEKAYLHAPKLMEARGTPWDVLAAEQILPRCHVTDLIQHEFRAPEIGTLKELNAIIKPNTALYHADKFGAIARLLGRGEEIPFSSVQPDGATGVTCNHGHGPGDFEVPSAQLPSIHDYSVAEILEELANLCRIDTTRKKVARFLVEQNIVVQGHLNVYGKGKKPGAHPKKKKPPLSDEEFKSRIASKQDVAVAPTNG